MHTNLVNDSSTHKQGVVLPLSWWSFADNVSAPFELSHPRCEFLVDFMRDPKHLKVLFITFFGRRNHRASKLCLNNFASNNFNKSCCYVMVQSMA